MFIVQIIYNLGILVTVSVISGFVNEYWKKHSQIRNLLQGITFGGIAILAMLNPFIVSPGIIFDGRSIVLSLCALFFGPISGCVAGLMAIAARMILGGSGSFMGVLVIGSSILIGLFFHSLRKRNRFTVSITSLFGFGIVVHIVMLLLMIFLPKNFVWITFQTIGISVIICYPIATVLIGKILVDQESRKKLFQELQESEEKFRTLVQYSHDPICVFNPDITFRFVNEAFAKTFGLTPADFKGEKTLSFISQDEWKSQLELIQRVLKTGNSAEAILAVNSKTGERRHFLTNVDTIKDEAGHVLWISCFSKDITDRKKAEEELKESEVRYRNLLEVAPVGIAVHAEGKIVFTNPAGKKLLGADTVDQLIGKPLVEIIHPDKLKTSNDRIRRMMNGEKGLYPVEDVYVRLDGRTINVEVVASPLTFNGKPAVQVIVTDITERKHAEAEFQKIQDRLRQSEKMESIGQLAGGIAHDFNNVLAGIIGFTDMSLGVAEKGSKLEGNLLKVLKAADRAKHLVQQILTFSRQAAPIRHVTMLGPIISEVMDLLRASIPSSVIIDVQLDDKVKPVLADSIFIHEVMLNLASNAVHAMDNKGTLSVRLYGVILTEMKLGNTGEIAPGSYAVIEVTDTGCGMDETTMSKVFDPFYTTKGVGEGTGMGLSVVLGIVQSHHGAIQMESAVGKGTTVRIYFPITEEETGVDTNESSTIVFGNDRIVFVDDEPMLVEMNVDALTGLGYTVNGFINSQDAFQYIRQKFSEIDLVITDQTMPNMTGVELVQRVKKFRADLPIILCTGYSREINAEMAAAIGINSVVLKPYGIIELSKSIRSVLDQSRKD
jgi:PAS domain S-box-containing protein